MAVREEDRVDARQAQRQRLRAQIRGGVDEDGAHGIRNRRAGSRELR